MKSCGDTNQVELHCSTLSIICMQISIKITCFVDIHRSLRCPYLLNTAYHNELTIAIYRCFNNIFQWCFMIWLNRFVYMQHPRIVFRRCSVKISAGILSIPIEVFCVFPQSSRTNSTSIGPQSLPYKPLPIHLSSYHLTWKSMLNNP